MSEWESFVTVLKGPRSDAVVLITTFLLTVFIDLTVAIEIGMVLAAFLFMRKMIQFSGVQVLEEVKDDNLANSQDEIDTFSVPKHVQVFEITGPMFFGAVYKFKEAVSVLESSPKVLIIRMKQVPIIDATGIKVLRDLLQQAKRNHTKLILSEVSSGQVTQELKKARLIFAIGKANIVGTFPVALNKAKDHIATLTDSYPK